jgi:hypothetical protein
MIGIGIWASKKIQNMSDCVVAGKSLITGVVHPEKRLILFEKERSHNGTNSIHFFHGFNPH